VKTPAELILQLVDAEAFLQDGLKNFGDNWPNLVKRRRELRDEAAAAVNALFAPKEPKA
jgi:hypothetical protein